MTLPDLSQLRIEDKRNQPGGFGGGSQTKLRSGIHFHLLNAEEQSCLARNQLNPKHVSFDCGHCGQSTSGRVLCTLHDAEGKAEVAWCHCSCEKQLPTVICASPEGTQFPEHCEFKAGTKWPNDISELFNEASKSYGASAYTATTMVCRKILMVCACMEGADEGKSFLSYVDYIVQEVLPLPRARTSIDAIRQIGNEANHKVAFVTRSDARRALEIVSYLLNSIYSLPDA